MTYIPHLKIGGLRHYLLKGQPTALTEYDEVLIRRLIEKITVCEENFTVEFKSGVTVDVNE